MNNKEVGILNTLNTVLQLFPQNASNNYLRIRNRIL